MKAVNLIPKDSRSNRTIQTGSLGPGHGVLAVLLIAIALACILVLTKNTISDRQAKLTQLNAEVAQTQALADSLAQYSSFQQQAQARQSTVRTIIASRFDWDTSLTELSQVVPSGTALQSLVGTVVPSASISGGSAGGSTGSLRGDISVPAIQLSGCTGSQDEVAELISRLRVVNGVTRVTLGDAQRGASSGAPVTSTGTTGPTSVCGSNPAHFDLVVFFTGIPNAGPVGIASIGATGATGAVGTSTTGGGSQ